MIGEIVRQMVVSWTIELVHGLEEASSYDTVSLIPTEVFGNNVSELNILGKSVDDKLEVSQLSNRFPLTPTEGSSNDNQRLDVL